ncbi:MAG: response regulator [Kofleriaceae bacterium]|nr:response regulator [Kofleriaceae bacterium]
MSLVLIIDDEYGLTEMAGELLVIAGYQVATAINGKLGLGMLATMRPDMILLDVMMPIMSGVELMRILRDDDEYREIPVVMMSAAGTDGVPPDVLAHASGFLKKPFTFDELMQMMTTILPVH